MQRVFLAGFAVLLAGWMSATAVGQEEEGGGGGARVPVPTRVTTAKATRTPAKTVKVEVPVTKAARNDTPAYRGEGWFQQYCAECHLGRWRKQGQLQASAPGLAGVLKAGTPEREAAVRQQIQRGSPNMPGFQNAFTPKEFDELIAYLKSL